MTTPTPARRLSPAVDALLHEMRQTAARHTTADRRGIDGERAAVAAIVRLEEAT